MEKIIDAIFTFISAIIGATGYTGIAILMAIESACIPLPSELIMPFAGYLVYKGVFNLYWAATAGAIGIGGVGTGLAQHRVLGKDFVVQLGDQIILTALIITPNLSQLN